MNESATFWHAADIGGIELLKASYVSHTFSRHTHAGYVIANIEQGVEGYDYRGRTHFAVPGDIILINPDTVHTGYAGVKSGWSYRVFYPSVDLLQGLAGDMAQKRGDMPFKQIVGVTPGQYAGPSGSRLKRQVIFARALKRWVLHARRGRCRSIG